MKNTDYPEISKTSCELLIRIHKRALCLQTFILFFNVCGITWNIISVCHGSSASGWFGIGAFLCNTFWTVAYISYLSSEYFNERNKLNLINEFIQQN
jgi:hypothetical protein